MVKEVPELPSMDRDHMWLKMDELLTWRPQSDVAKPYPPKAGGRRMIEHLLQNLDALLLVLCGVAALAAAALMLVLRHPMQVAMALISTMALLGAIYGLVGVHFIAAFQVLIYVSAVMVFMVYVIMLLDVRDPSFTRRFSTLLVPGVIGGVLLLAVLAYALLARALRAGQHDGLVRPAAVLDRLPQRVLAALRADVGAAGGGGRGGAGRHQGHPEEPWISCTSCC